MRITDLLIRFYPYIRHPYILFAVIYSFIIRKLFEFEIIKPKEIIIFNPETMETAEIPYDDTLFRNFSYELVLNIYRNKYPEYIDRPNSFDYCLIYRGVNVFYCSVSS